MHYYQFNIGDYASHTSRLTPLEDLAYRRMLDLYYLNEQPLNGCVSDVAREIGLSEHVSSVEYILGKFFIEKDNCFSQKRIDLEIKKYKSNVKNKSKAGIASAKARQLKISSKVTEVEQVLNITSTGEQLNNNHKPITINQEPVTIYKDITNDRFTEFWNLYGKKTDSSKCKAKFAKLSKAEIELVFEKLPTYIKSTPDKQYRKNPITWLNGKCWNDEIIQPTSNAKSTHSFEQQVYTSGKF